MGLRLKVYFPGQIMKQPIHSQKSRSIASGLLYVFPPSCYRWMAERKLMLICIWRGNSPDGQYWWSNNLKWSGIVRIAGDGSRKEGCESLLCWCNAGGGPHRLTASVSVSGLRRPVSVTRRQAPDRHGSVRGPGSRELKKVFVEIPSASGHKTNNFGS